MKRQRISQLFIISISFMLMASVFIGGSAVCGAAEKAITLTYGSFIPETHYFAKADKSALAKLEQETNNRVKFQTFFGGSLISTKESYAKLKAGVADIANVSVVYGPGFDLTKSQRLFWYGCDENKGLEIYDKVRSKIPEIEKEWADIMVMQVLNMPSFHMITTKPVRKLNDLKGMKFKCTPELIAPLNKLGAEGISMPAPEIYIGLQKGIIDGVIMPYDVFRVFKLTELCKYTTRLDYFLGPYPTRAMNLDSLNRLPKDIQASFKGIRKFWSSASQKGSLGSKQGGIDAAKAVGVEFIELPPSELAKFYKLLEIGALEAAKKADAKGLPGSAVFKEIRSHID
ncbi:TRAP transporter substrate-binding protein DctP [Thermodesulfobacteriota bacterium]